MDAVAERVLMVGIHPKGASARLKAQDSLDELAQLVMAAGGQVAARILQARDRGQEIGEGKLDEVMALITAQQVDVVVVDQELTASMARRWEHALGIPVIDRTQVILDIFADRATSREGRLQVRMAQLSYWLPRLAGQGRSLSRLGGGIGTRGPGETRLELDRRRIRSELASIRQDLAKLDTERKLRRERRQRGNMPVIALVGYTNVGKSTLFAHLTHRLAPSRDALFVTLDPSVRRIFLPQFGPALLVDTVGFVKRLPHTLIAAFQSTLDEIRSAALIIEVANAASMTRRQESQAVDEVLAQLGAEHIPRLLVENQWDRMPANAVAFGIPVSAQTGYNLDVLAHAMTQVLGQSRPVVEYFVPWNATEVMGWIRAEGAILDERPDTSGMWVQVRAAPHVRSRVAQRLSEIVGEPDNPRQEGESAGPEQD